MPHHQKSHPINNTLFPLHSDRRGYDPEDPSRGYITLPFIYYGKWHNVLLYCASTDTQITRHYSSDGVEESVQQLLLDLGAANGSVYHDDLQRVLEIKCCIYMNVIGFERLFRLLDVFSRYGLNIFISPMDL